MKVRRATKEDLPAVRQLLESVNLPCIGVDEHIETFKVMENKNEIAGSVGLEVHGDRAVLRSLAVARKYQGNGFGSMLFEEVIDLAVERNIKQIYLLTETAGSFFAQRNFREIDRERVEEPIRTTGEFTIDFCSGATCMTLVL